MGLDCDSADRDSASVPQIQSEWLGLLPQQEERRGAT